MLNIINKLKNKNYKKISKKKYFYQYLKWIMLLNDEIIVTDDCVLMRTFEYFCHDMFFLKNEKINRIAKNINFSFKDYDKGWTLFIDTSREENKMSSYVTNDAPKIAKVFEKIRLENMGTYYKNRFFISICYQLPKVGRIEDLKFEENSKMEEALENYIEITDRIFNLYKSTFKYVKKLKNDELLTYLHSTYSKNHKIVTPEYPFYLNEYLADDQFKTDNVSKYGDTYILSRTVNDTPLVTRLNMLSLLLETNVEFRFTTRFIFDSADKTKKLMKSHGRFNYGKSKTVGDTIMESVTKQKSNIVNTDKIKIAQETQKALETLADGEIKYGKLTTTITIRGKNYYKIKKDMDYLVSICNNKGFSVKNEKYNNPWAFLGSIPGHFYNMRRPMLSTRNLVHLIPSTDAWSGVYENEHIKKLTGVGHPHMICKSVNSIFYFNQNVGDVGHSLIVGETGGGKTILLGTLVMQFIVRYPGAKIIYFDIDKGSKNLCKNLGGNFFDLGTKNSGFKLNPFYGLDNKKHRDWLFQFLITYFIAKNIVMTPRLEQEIHDSLKSMATVSPQDHNFNEFENHVQSEEIRRMLKPFTNGEYANLFKSGDDKIEDNIITVFEMKNIMRMGREILSFVLDYLFYKTTIIIEKYIDSPKMLISDENWAFMSSESYVKRQRSDLKTMRKFNTYVMLATQHIDDINSEMFNVTIDSCMTKILLPNVNAANQSEFYKKIGLNDVEINCLAEKMRAKKHYMYFSKKGRQIFELSLDKRAIDILTKDLRKIAKCA